MIEISSVSSIEFHSRRTHLSTSKEKLRNIKFLEASSTLKIRIPRRRSFGNMGFGNRLRRNLGFKLQHENFCCTYKKKFIKTGSCWFGGRDSRIPSKPKDVEDSNRLLPVELSCGGLPVPMRHTGSPWIRSIVDLQPEMSELNDFNSSGNSLMQAWSTLT